MEQMEDENCTMEFEEVFSTSSFTQPKTNTQMT